VYHSFRVTADYKSTLRDLTGEEYEVKKAEVHLRAAKRLLKACNNITVFHTDEICICLYTVLCLHVHTHCMLNQSSVSHALRPL
jgi:hypothetical protein